MMKLSETQRDLLYEAVRRQNEKLVPLLDRALSGSILTIEDANAIRSAIGDELAATGVDPEFGAVNDRGKQLDTLIDRVAQMSELDQQ
jgi:hypothetical protein